jgi:hypothetical protein
MTDRMTKMVNGLLPDGTLIRACEVTFGYLEKQDDRIEKMKAALREIEILEVDPRCSGQMWVETLKEVARKALEGKDE